MWVEPQALDAWLEANPAEPPARWALTGHLGRIKDPASRARAANDAMEDVRALVVEVATIRADAVRAMLAGGMTMTEAGNLLGVTKARISGIANGAGRAS